MTDQEGTGVQHERLTAELRDLANRVDPPPELLAEFAGAALAWRRLDAELAELTYDSVTDESLVDTVRGTAAPRLLMFDVGGITVEVEITVDGEQRRLIGQVVPMQPASIEVRHAGGVTTTEADDLGRFGADGLPAGPLSLRCRLRDGEQVRVVHTEWSAI